MVGQERFVPFPGGKLWTESFGKPGDPAVVLIIGLGTQGIFWPDDFCEALAKEGYFVVRFDHRDVGLSTHLADEQGAYSLRDLAQDVVGVLDAYEIKDAHIIGGSMGGMISFFLGAYHAERVKSIVAIGATPDPRVFFDAIDGLDSRTAYPISEPLPNYIDWCQQALGIKDRAIKDNLQFAVEGWRICNGEGSLFSTEKAQSIIALSAQRGQSPHVLARHRQAILTSFENGDFTRAVQDIRCPILIMHGQLDPAFLPDHGIELHRQISHSKLILMENMGHSPDLGHWHGAFTQIMGFLKS